MDYEELVGEPGFENDVNVEGDELILYGCHLCQDLAYENYDDLEEHLQKHIENGDVIDVKEEYDSDEAQDSCDLASETDSHMPISDEGSEIEQKYHKDLWQCAIQSRKDSGVVKIHQDDNELSAKDPELWNEEFSSKRKPMSSLRYNQVHEGREVKRRKRRGVGEEKEFKCDICNKGFERKHSLVIHLRVHTGERPYKCKECGASYKQSGDLTMHLRTHVGLKPFSCDVCNAKFLRRGDINRHMVIHSKEKPFKCQACGRNYTRSYHLKTHWQNKHCEEDVWHGKDIRTGEKVNGKVEKQVKRYECDLCNKTFKDKRNLKVHKLLHTGYKPFKCDVCDKSFAHSGSFNIHKRIHTGEKPYACKICNERFNCSSAVGKHHRRAHEKS